MTDTFHDKHPEADRPYPLTWVLDTGETIVASTWEYTGPDTTLTLTNESISQDGLSTQVFIGGGTLGAQYKVKNSVTTDSTPPRDLVTVKYINIREVIV